MTRITRLFWQSKKDPRLINAQKAVMLATVQVDKLLEIELRKIAGDMR